MWGQGEVVFNIFWNNFCNFVVLKPGLTWF